MADKKTKISDWLTIQTEDGTMSVRTRGLSSGELGADKYDLFLRVEQSQEGFNPVLLMRVRASEISALPTHIDLNASENDRSRIISSSEADPVYSIINKDYVSSFRFPVGEEDLLKAFRKEASLDAVVDDVASRLPVDQDDSLLYLRLKEKLTPDRLTREQKEILRQEKEKEEERIRKENLRQQELVADKERRKEALLLAVSKSLAGRILETTWLSATRKDILGFCKEIAKEQDLVIKDPDSFFFGQFLDQKKDVCLTFDEAYKLLKEKCGIYGNDDLRFRDEGMTRQDVNSILDGKKSLEEVKAELYDSLSKENRKRLVKEYSKLALPIILRDSLNDDEDSLFSGIDYPKFSQFVMDTAPKENIEERYGISAEHLSRTRQFAWDIKENLKNKKLIDDYRVPNKDMTPELANDLIDEKITVEDALPKLLVRKYIRRAVLADKLLGPGKEHRLYCSLEPGMDVLQEKGIVSTGCIEDEDGRHFYKLFVTDYQTACDILDGKRPALAKRSASGCYVATCVYGSYDCPEVWTLRRFRDHKLRYSLPGRWFIKAYYATSPTLVKWFGGNALFRSLNRRILDWLVNALKKEGFSDGPYQDGA